MAEICSILNEATKIIRKFQLSQGSYKFNEKKTEIAFFYANYVNKFSLVLALTWRQCNPPIARSHG